MTSLNQGTLEIIHHIVNHALDKSIVLKKIGKMVLCIQHVDASVMNWLSNILDNGDLE